MLTIDAIPAFSDNYIWCLKSANNNVFVVDPGDASAVITYLEKHQLHLTGILVTHWHPDHIGGLADLQDYCDYNLRIIGPHSERIQRINERVANSDSINVLGIPIEVLEVPGHTLDHIAFFNTQQQQLFCGDTLFAAGCGRIFEGNAKMMHESLQRLAKLPSQTKVYCAHEYTLSNLAFALAVEPNNESLQKRYNEVKSLRAEGKISLPSTIAQELDTNPFLRVKEKTVIASAKQHTAMKTTDDIATWKTFEIIREWKDDF